MAASVVDHPVVLELRELADRFESVVGALRPNDLSGPESLRLLGLFTRSRTLAAAGEALVAGRVVETSAFVAKGHETAAHLVASAGGVSLSRAHEIVDTGRRLAELPATADALRNGEVSVAQAAAIAKTAVVVPDAEAELLEFAGKESVRRLQDKARDVKLAADDDRLGRYQRQCEARTLSYRTADDGMVVGGFAFPPDLGALVVNRLEHQADRQYKLAYKRGERESHDKYLADALVTLLSEPGEVSDTKRQAPRADFVVHVSHAALLRGEVGEGEVCMIQGFGPIPVERARELLADAFVKGVLVDGTDVKKVRHFGRHINAELRTALEVREVCTHGDVYCTDPGCDRRLGLEMDHTHERTDGGPTEYDNLGPKCRPGHRTKTERKRQQRQQRKRKRENGKGREPP